MKLAFKTLAHLAKVFNPRKSSLFLSAGWAGHLFFSTRGKAVYLKLHHNMV